MASLNSTLTGPPTPAKPADQQQLSTQLLLSRLPSLPTVAVRLLGLMGRPDVNLKEVSNLIVSDGALTAEILRMSNSAMFGVRSEVRSILQALAVLGCERVKGLTCTIALRSYLGNALQIPALKRCWRHNLATAVVASEISEWARQDAGEAYTAGILHDIGRLALVAADPARYLQLVDSAAYHGGSLSSWEIATYGIDHSEAGEWLATSWSLPPVLCKSIRDHHQPNTGKYYSLSGILNYSCRIADALGFAALETYESTDAPVEEFVAQLPEPVRSRLRVTIPELQELIASRVNALEA